jgi:uncharacterized protein (TIGR03000 family)
MNNRSYYRWLGLLSFALCVGVASGQTIILPPNKALLIVQVPANATVTIGGYTVTQAGTDRWLMTPEVPLNQTFSYDVEARWVEGGQEKRVVRRVEFQAGQTARVDFRSAGGAEEIPLPKTVVEIKTKPETKQPETKKPETKVPETKVPATKSTEIKTREFLFIYGGTIKGLAQGKPARVWLPVATSGPEQDVFLAKVRAPGQDEIHKEKQYGNTILYFEAKADNKGEIPFEVTYEVRRREVRTDLDANLFLKPAPQENLVRFLQPDAKVPTAGKPLELIKDKQLPNDQFAAAKVLYDVVNNHMKYSKQGTGWGQGDAVWACDSKFGNCSDFHSLFISMARGNKIPSKFEMGFPIPAMRGRGDVGGYHCWAWFLPNKRGWVPVDISEANRNPDLKEYYFGNLTEDRVRFTTGRDIQLEPRQKGPALNFFIYPYAEVDGQPYPGEKIERRFAYRDMP